MYREASVRPEVVDHKARAGRERGMICSMVSDCWLPWPSTIFIDAGLGYVSCCRNHFSCIENARARLHALRFIDLVFRITFE